MKCWAVCLGGWSHGRLHDGGGDYWPGLHSRKTRYTCRRRGVVDRRAEESATCEDRMLADTIKHKACWACRPKKWMCSLGAGSGRYYLETTYQALIFGKSQAAELIAYFVLLLPVNFHPLFLWLVYGHPPFSFLLLLSLKLVRHWYFFFFF